MAQNKKMLLVDDDLETVKVLEDYFKTKGYTVLTAIDGKFALDVFRRQRPPLVLLDMQMPAVNGLEVLRIIRKESPATKVIVITGLEEEYKSQCEKLGIDGFFLKPIKINELTKRIEEVMATVSDTTVYPTKETEPELQGKLLKAKILCAEKESTPLSVSLEKLIQEPDWAKFEIKVTNTQADTIKAVNEFKPDIVILSARLPKSKDEPEVCSTGDLTTAIIFESSHKPKATLMMPDQYVPGTKVSDHDFTTADSNRLAHLRKNITKACLKHKLFVEKQ